MREDQRVYEHERAEACAQDKFVRRCRLCTGRGGGQTCFTMYYVPNKRAGDGAGWSWRTFPTDHFANTHFATLRSVRMCVCSSSAHRRHTQDRMSHNTTHDASPRGSGKGSPPFCSPNHQALSTNSHCHDPTEIYLDHHLSSR